MRDPRVRQPPPMRLELRAPKPPQLLPGIQIDPLKALTGYALEDLLRDVLEAHPWEDNGQRVYPVSLRDGVSLSVPLGQLGELGFGHQRGQLQITAPALASMFLGQLPHQVGPHEVLQTASGRLSRYTLAPPPGATWRMALTGTLALTLTRL